MSCFGATSRFCQTGQITSVSLSRTSFDILWSLPEGPIRMSEANPCDRRHSETRAPLSIPRPSVRPSMRPSAPPSLTQAVTGERVLATLTHPVMWKPRLLAKVTAQERWLHFSFHSGFVWRSADKNGDVSSNNLVPLFTYGVLSIRPSFIQPQNEN